MAELRPYPFGALVTRAFRELETYESIFDLPARKFWTGEPDRDLSVRFHGRPAATPLGPAAGPQSQMAQNIVLSWLGGGRIMELKTVQVRDDLKIPRPCIDMQTIGFNVEWSQELRLEQSLEEYVKGSMLVELLAASGRLAVPRELARTVYDMSVGYDLAGIRGERVGAFIRGMLDAAPVVERLRAELPAFLGPLRDLDFTTRLSDTLTLSTFHGCPPAEIERIVEFLLEEHRLHCIVKLNPMLLGPDETRRLLHEQLGYRTLRVPDSAFERDTRWEQALAFADRLGARAAAAGLGFGLKFTNTLIVENHRDFFPKTEREMYLSGPPLHVLAVNLVGRLRRGVGDRWPVSFSAGIDRLNFADAVAIGLVPVTVCSDLLKTGGYARAQGYLRELGRRMGQAGAATVDELVLRAYGHAEAALGRLRLDLGSPEAAACRAVLDRATPLAALPATLRDRWLSETRVLNTETYVDRATSDPRYAAPANAKPPRKIGSHLVLFDCVTCDKCVPVCPNDANFTFVLPALEVPVLRLVRTEGRWVAHEAPPVRIAQEHQIATFADFCNECGNCDVFCPEDGGPYLVKPRFFGSAADFDAFPGHDGFHVQRAADADVVLARISGRRFRLALPPQGPVRFEGDRFRVQFDERDPAATVEGDAAAEIDLTYFHIMRLIGRALLAPTAVSYPSLLA